MEKLALGTKHELLRSGVDVGLLALILAILLTLTTAARVAHGTAVVVLPNADGILVAADRKVEDLRQRRRPLDRSKGLLVGTRTVTVGAGASRVVGNAKSSAPIVLFDSFEYVKREIPRLQKKMNTNSLFPIAADLGNNLRLEFSQALAKSIDKQYLVSKHFKEKRPVLINFVISFDQTSQKFEACRILLHCRPQIECVVECVTEKSLFPNLPHFFMVSPSAELDSELRDGDNKRLSKTFRDFTHLGRSWKTKLRKEGALRICAEILALAHKIDPADVGQSIDAWLVTKHGVERLVENKDSAEVIRY